jgi:hypothetical protein
MMTSERRNAIPATATNPRAGERGATLILVLFITLILSTLVMALLGIASSDNVVAHNDVSTEGAFYAAEAGLNTGISQLSSNPTSSTMSIPVTTISGSYSFRSGTRAAGSAQPLVFVSVQPRSGYSIAGGSAYNPNGYLFYSYRINTTGTGPRNAQREIEALAEYGPVAQ